MAARNGEVVHHDGHGNGGVERVLQRSVAGEDAVLDEGLLCELVAEKYKLAWDVRERTGT